MSLGFELQSSRRGQGSEHGHHLIGRGTGTSISPSLRLRQGDLRISGQTEWNRATAVRSCGSEIATDADYEWPTVAEVEKPCI